MATERDTLQSVYDALHNLRGAGGDIYKVLVNWPRGVNCGCLLPTIPGRQELELAMSAKYAAEFEGAIHFDQPDAETIHNAVIRTLADELAKSKVKFEAAQAVVCGCMPTLRAAKGEQWTSDLWDEIAGLERVLQDTEYYPDATAGRVSELFRAIDTRKEQVFAAMRMREPPSKADSPNWPPPYDAKAMMSCSELADKFGMNPDALKKKLKRWRHNNDDGWKEFDTDRRNEARIRYVVGAVIGIITEMHGGKLPRGCPHEKML